MTIIPRDHFRSLANVLLCGLASAALGACETGMTDRDFTVYDDQRGDPAALPQGNAAFDAELRVPSCPEFAIECDSGNLLQGRANIGPEPNQPNTLGATCADDLSGQYQSDESIEQLRIFTADGSYLDAGAEMTIEAVIFPYALAPTSDSLDFFYTADVSNPDWQLIATVVPSAAGRQTLSATTVIPEGGTAMHAIRAQLRWGGQAQPCESSGFNDHDDLAFRVGAPDLEPPAVSLISHIDQDRAKGKTIVVAEASDNVGVADMELFVDDVSLGAQAAATYQLTWDTASVSDGTHTLRVVARDAAGNEGTLEARVSVHNNDGEGNGLYDGAIKVPACHAANSICDAGDLLLGRGPRGPNGGTEPNYPNTLNDSCTDGDYGTYRSGEQLDGLSIYTIDGEPMRAGANVVIAANVWADWSDFEDDSLDLYYTADLANPSWQHISTVVPTDGESQIIEVNFQLPQSGMQAIRGVFRWAGSPSPCAPSGWTDHDDVAFMVAP